jgi:hypothetical protein
MNVQTAIRPSNVFSANTSKQVDVSIAADGTITVTQGDPLEVQPGDTVQWSCTTAAAGTLMIFFGPFAALTYTASKPETFPIPDSPISVSFRPRGGGRHFRYIFQWIPSSGPRTTLDPEIIVDPTAGDGQ